MGNPIKFTHEHITYRYDGIPELKDLLLLFENSGYFPIKDKSDTKRIMEMFNNASLVVSAWHGKKLVGISRCLSDFSYCCYLSDLAVHEDYKENGIGRQLVELSKEIPGERCKLILHSNPQAEGFYAKIGMKKIDSAYIIQRSF